MKIREIHCKFRILRGAAGFVLYPWIFYNTRSNAYQQNFESLRRHEWAHVDQVRRDGWFVFYGKYIWQWLTEKHHNRPYEIEAKAESMKPRAIFK